MKEFKVNEYITQKLGGDKTNIYIKGQLVLVNYSIFRAIYLV